MSHLGPLQLTPEYKSRLAPAFLRWYLATCTSRRNVYVHWSAGPYDLPFADYHYCVHGDGRTETTFEGNPFDAIRPHTYARNHGSVGVGVLCMASATSQDYGAYPPTREQQLRTVEQCAAICANYRIPVGRILTHAEAGDNVDYSSPDDPEAPHDPYGPAHGCERWDWFLYTDPATLRLRTARADTRHVSPAPAGLLYWPDWLRGEVALRLQEMSRQHWDPARGRGL